MKFIFPGYAAKAIICISWIFFSVLPALSMGNDSIGKVIALRGKAFAISKDSNSKRLSLKSPIFLNDTIKTENGRLQMMFKDNTLVTLGRNSQMQVTKYLWEKGNHSSAMETKVEEGSFRIMGGAITRIAPKNFKTDTPSGTIGIRGSMYAGRVDGQNLFVLFQGGKGIYVENDAGRVEITIPGFSSRIENVFTPPAPPKRTEPETLQELEFQLAQLPDDAPAEATINTGEELTAEPPTDRSDDLEDISDETLLISEGDTNQTGDGADPIVTQNEDMEILMQMESIVNDVTINSAQDQLDGALTPEGTEQTIQFMLAQLGAADLMKSTTRPFSGVWSYKGVMKNTQYPEEPVHGMKFIVNWSTSRIIGFEDDSGSLGQGFAFGEIGTAGEIFNMSVYGSDAYGGGGVMALSGYETFGHFYGASQDGLGLAMEGYDYNIQDQTQSKFWSDLVAAVVESTSGSVTTTPGTWEGYFIGISENMSDPNTDRRIFMNNDDTTFSLTVDDTDGTVSGSLSSINDMNGSSQSITGGIGGSVTDSVYINDKVLAAKIVSGDVSPLASGIKTYGNFLVSANEPMLSSYTTWGYWEMAYDESGAANDDYHLHVPGSRWIAGLKGAVLTSGFIGVYKGGAKGVMYSTSNTMTDLTGGQTTLNIDFTGGNPNPVTGNISFNEVSLPVMTDAVGDLTNDSFSAYISTAATPSASNSSVNGSFYGPAIAGGNGTGPGSVGGNFHAEMPDGNKYSGIFGGDLQP